jgi:predicted metal-dependent hydrolase
MKLRNKDNFKTEVREWATKLKVKPAQIRVQKMRGKWASCSPGKWVTFNEALFSENRNFQSYVIVHELLHLRIPNHGKLFKSLLSIHVPNWERWQNYVFDCLPEDSDL